MTTLPLSFSRITVPTGNVRTSSVSVKTTFGRGKRSLLSASGLDLAFALAASTLLKFDMVTSMAPDSFLSSFRAPAPDIVKYNLPAIKSKIKVLIDL